MNCKTNIWFLIPIAAAAGVALMSLSACAPQQAVKHDYTFTPPMDEAGLACSNSCIDAHKACVDSCEKWSYRCDKFERKAVRGDAMANPGKDPACSVVVCENKCADTLSSCYTGCGGQVTKATTVTRADPTKPTE